MKKENEINLMGERVRPTINSVDKRLEGKGDLSETKELKKLAEKDPMTHIDLEFSAELTRLFEEAKEEGFSGTFTDWLDTKSDDELKRLLRNSGGVVVDFTSMDPKKMKDLFKAEYGRDPQNAKELVRGIKMMEKGFDLDGIKVGAFGD
jgi:hypothetical protein